MKHLTIKDIARMAGVSAAAVSYVMNGKAGVGDETREKIQMIIEQTGFSPNVHTRRLNLKKSFNINLAIKQNASPIANKFYVEILLGILAESRNYQYNIVLSDITDLESEKRLLANINNSDSDGIIFVQDPSQHLIAEVAATDLPFIIVDTQQLEPEFTTVRIDYMSAARTSVEYLIAQGHQAIAFISMENNRDFYVNTFNGYRFAMENAELPFMPGWIQPAAFDEASSYECMDRILRQKKLPTAVFCASDVFAYSAMQCAKDRGLKIPDDISFFGMDDLQLSKYTQPALSTIHIDGEFMGRSAMRLIDKIINGKSYESVVLSSTTIIERDSVRKLNQIVESTN